MQTGSLLLSAGTGSVLVSPGKGGGPSRVEAR